MSIEVAGERLDMPTSDQLLADMKLLHPKLIDLSLGRVERLLTKLGDPQFRLPPVVHVAGTNGKGSVTAYLKAMLEAAGRRVHVYTSPHLVRFHERIALAGPDGKARPIDEDYLVDVLMRASAANDGDDITQFEITTAAAFLAFSETPADMLLLEVGLGGRLDATNVVPQPALSVITPISFDHADKLGATLEKIASEKAGILKAGRRAVISTQEPDALAAIRHEAERVGAALTVWGEHFEAFEQRGRLIVQREDQLLDLPLPGLVGRHQIVNSGTAVAAALELDAAMPELQLGETAIAGGLVNVSWPARMQRITSGILTAELGPATELWLDGGHNPGAGHVLAQSLADLEERSPKPLYLVIGMLSQKDAGGFLAPFLGLARTIITVPIPRAHEPPHSPDGLAEIARSLGFQAASAIDVPDALRQIEAHHPGPKRIMIAGSLYLAGAVLALQEGVTAQPN
jgi:dihydrofolate synthase/folylpolyglutamate synthase